MLPQLKPRILIVDDDESILTNISQSLVLEGYEVDTACTGRKAIAYSTRRFYNLALIDVRLPDMDGTDLLAFLKRTTPKMVKIILTGFPNLENSIKAINNGVDAYLTKPVKIPQLLQTIKEQLRKQSEEYEFTEEKIAEYIETRLRKMNTYQLPRPY